VIGPGIVSTHHAWPCGVACLSQRIEYPVDAISSCARAILSRAPQRSDLEDEARPFPEQMIVRNALSFAVGCGDFLAGRASDEDVGEISKVIADPLRSQVAHVGIHDASGMTGGEDGAAPIVDLTGGDRADTGPLQTKRPAASGAAEQVDGEWRMTGSAGHDSALSTVANNGASPRMRRSAMAM
jgi:hypothetical protein